MVANWFGGIYKDNRDPKNMFARFAVEPEKLFTDLRRDAASRGRKEGVFPRPRRLRHRARRRPQP